MNIARIGLAALAATAAIPLAGCSDYYDDYGYGYSRPYSYGSYGYSSRPYYYGSGYATPYAYYTPYYGWYGNYYYPGVGIYIYDRSGSRYRWNDTYRNYWESRRGSDYSGRENWSGYRYRRRY